VPRLRLAIADAKAVNMPNDTINRAIKKGTGELEGVNVEEILYEGYGPNGVAIMCDILTDNRNRTASELRKLFEKKGGTLGNPGSVTWMFETKGVIEVPQSAIDEDDLMEVALEAGAEDVKPEGDNFTVLTQPDDFTEVQTALKDKGLELAVAEIMRLPSNTVVVDDPKEAQRVMTAFSASGKSLPYISPNICEAWLMIDASSSLSSSRARLPPTKAISIGA